jgi:hypothetical protein
MNLNDFSYFSANFLQTGWLFIPNRTDRSKKLGRSFFLTA